MSWPREDTGNWTRFNDLTSIHHNYFLTVVGNDAKIMSHQQQRLLMLISQNCK